MPSRKAKGFERGPGVSPKEQYSVPGTQYSEGKSKLTPCRKGELAEIEFLGRATALGLMVTKPFGNAAPYDFLIERGGRALRIQVKSCWVPKDRGPSPGSGFRQRTPAPPPLGSGSAHAR